MPLEDGMAVGIVGSHGKMCLDGRWFFHVTRVSIPWRASIVGPGTVAIFLEVP